jgi:hypothetical protein
MATPTDRVSFSPFCIAMQASRCPLFSLATAPLPIAEKVKAAVYTASTDMVGRSLLRRPSTAAIYC